MTTQNQSAVVTGASAGLGAAYANRLADRAFPAEWVMTADDAVDAALAGLDDGEPVTIPSLPEIGDWESFEKARQTLIPNLSRQVPAHRYRA